jgi:hypothetical protein
MKKLSISKIVSFINLGKFSYFHSHVQTTSSYMHCAHYSSTSYSGFRKHLCSAPTKEHPLPLLRITPALRVTKKKHPCRNYGTTPVLPAILRSTPAWLAGKLSGKTKVGSVVEEVLYTLYKKFLRFLVCRHT